MGNREQDLRRGWRQQGLLLFKHPCHTGVPKGYMQEEFLSVHLHLAHLVGAPWISHGMASQDQGMEQGPIRPRWIPTQKSCRR